MMPTSAAARVPPGPRRRLLGSLVAPGRDTLGILTKYARQYGDVVFFGLGGERAYLLNQPSLIRDVLVTHQRNFTKSRGLERARKLLGDGLLTAEGATHLRSRRLLQPAFHRDRIASYASTMVEHADRMRARWVDQQTFDISKEMMRVTLAIAGQALFSTNVESKADEVGVAVTQVMETFFLNLLPFADFIEKLPIPALKRAQAARMRLDALIFKMIADRRASGVDHGDLLSMLLAAQDDEPASEKPLAQGSGPANGSRGNSGFSDRQIRDEAMTLLLAGHETTANALTWTWYLLSQHPAAEAMLHGELDRVLGGRLPTAADLPQLAYVERVVTEAMRLYPPAWIIGRRAIGAYPLDGYLVPARSIIFMSPWVTQRDPRWFPDPEKFSPDRWTPDFKAALPPFAYFPFGGGARRCIGEHFAWMELTLLVATIAQRWSFRLVPNHPVTPHPLVTLRAKHGMMVRAIRVGNRLRAPAPLHEP